MTAGAAGALATRRRGTAGVVASRTFGVLVVVGGAAVRIACWRLGGRREVVGRGPCRAIGGIVALELRRLYVSWMSTSFSVLGRECGWGKCFN